MSYTPLHEAARDGNKDELIRILDEGNIDINVKDSGGRTPLFQAAYGDHIDIVATLLTNGASVNEKDDENQPLGFLLFVIGEASEESEKKEALKTRKLKAKVYLLAR